MLPTPHPTVVFQRLDDGAMLFAPETETYFGLNAVGALVWQALPPAHRTLDSMVAVLAAQFGEVPAATIRDDILELLAALEREGLVRTAGDAGDAAPTS